MLNLSPFQDRKPLEIYREILTSKTDPALVAALQAINADIEAQFGLFSTNARSNTLESIPSLAISEDNKTNLRKLYIFKNSVIQEIKTKVMGNGRGRPINECQYCTINSVSSMDHVMPKNIFPEFSVNPQNLFPCCLECNGYKSETWLRDARRQFLNLYLDILPDTQYLFVEITHLNEVVFPRFYLENRSGIDAGLFELIEKHYGNLHLFRRFAESSNTVITSLMAGLSSFPGSMRAEDVTSFVRDGCIKTSQYFGKNYWKSVLQSSLSEDAGFLRSCGFTP